MKTTVLIIVFCLLIIPINALAHPGRTASDGCHYCRTNCDKWGEVWNQRHCHNGGSAPTTTIPKYTPPKTNYNYTNTSSVKNIAPQETKKPQAANEGLLELEEILKTLPEEPSPIKETEVIQKEQDATKPTEQQKESSEDGSIMGWLFAGLFGYLYWKKRG